MNEQSRNLLWIKFKEGDTHALSSLYKEFANELFSYGLKIAKDEHLVKDCLQEIFIQLIDKRKDLLITSTIHLYLFKSLRNKILEELRSKNRKHEIERLIKKEDIHEQNMEQRMIVSEEETDIRKLIGSAIAILPNRQSEIIYLKYTEGLNYDEIAEVLQIDKASARTLLYRSLKSIKEQLGKNLLILPFIVASTSSRTKHTGN